MNVHDIEYAAIQILRPELELRGYEILDDVPATLLPSGLRGYQPDFVAKNENGYLAVEIKNRRHPSIEQKLKEIERIFHDSEGWSFKVYYYDEMKSPKGPSVQDDATIDNALSQAMHLYANNEMSPAFLLTWAAFEAIARKLNSSAFEKPQSPGRLVTVLAENGQLTPDQATIMRELIVKRNALVHGQLDIEISNNDLKGLLGAIVDLRKKISPQ